MEEAFAYPPQPFDELSYLTDARVSDVHGECRIYAFGRSGFPAHRYKAQFTAAPDERIDLQVLQLFQQEVRTFRGNKELKYFFRFRQVPAAEVAEAREQGNPVYPAIQMGTQVRGLAIRGTLCHHDKNGDFVNPYGLVARYPLIIVNADGELPGPVDVTVARDFRKLALVRAL